MYSLPKAERQVRGEHLPFATNARLFGLVCRSTHIFINWRLVWVLTRLNERLQPGQNDIHIAPRTVPISTNAFWSEEPLKHVPMINGHYTVNVQAVICTFVLKWCHQLLDVCKKPSGLLTQRTWTTVGRKGIIDLIIAPSLIVASTAWVTLYIAHTWHIYQWGQNDPWTPIPYHRSWTQVFPGSMQRIIFGLYRIM